MALHKDLTGADLHEPKGVASATLDQVYRADGAGSGSWQTITIPSGTFKIVITEFTSSGTWTKPANFFGMRFHIIGGGGGANSGGAPLTNGGTTSIGTLASVGGSLTSTGTTGTGGAVGTTPSGAKGFTGNSGVKFNNNTMPAFTYFPLVLDAGNVLGTTWASVLGGVPVTSYPYLGKGVGGAHSSGAAVAGSGASMFGWLANSALGATETITIGAGGTGSGGTTDNGRAGYCLIEEFITV